MDTNTPFAAQRGARGLTLIEVLIGLLLTGAVATFGFNYYRSQHEVYLAQTDISDRQGSLRSALTELSRQVRMAGYLVPGGDKLRYSPGYDTLEIYLANMSGSEVDTLRYFVRDESDTRALMRQVNRLAPEVFAEHIDSAHFVPVGSSPVYAMAIALVSTPQSQYEGTSLSTPRRLGTTVNLRNR